jgi:hypothetical protein
MASTTTMSAVVSSATMKMPAISLRCVASVEDAVEDVDAGIMQWPRRHGFDVGKYATI